MIETIINKNIWDILCSKIRDNFTIFILNFLNIIIFSNNNFNGYSRIELINKNYTFDLLNETININNIYNKNTIKYKTKDDKTISYNTEIIYINDNMKLVIINTMNTINNNLYITNITEELKIPLNNILQTSDVLENLLNNEKQKNKLEIIQENSYNLLTTLNDIIDITQFENKKVELKFSIFNIKQCIKDTLDMVNDMIISKNINIKYIIDITTPEFIICDYERLRQVLLNLVNNSIKYTSYNGSITILLKALKLNKYDSSIFRIDDLYIDDNDIINENSNNYMLDLKNNNIYNIIFKIIDNGVGIKTENIPYLFTPFSRNNTISKNIKGLGLPICKYICELLNGKIYIEKTEQNKGTTVYFEITAIQYMNINIEKYKENLKGKTILIVNSDKEITLGINDICNDLGIKCIICTNYKEFLLYIQRKNNIDIIFIDINNNIDNILNNININDLTKIKKHTPSIIMMIDNNYEKLENFDINLYIKKPYSYDKFVYGILISFGLINDIKGFSIINNIFDTYKQTYNQNVRQISIDNKKNNIDNDKKTSLKILLVDDIISNYKKTMELLNELDYYNIKQIDNINYNIITDSYDIIFLDIKMPSISVFNICKEIRNKISSHVAIVIITEFDMSVIEKSYLIDTNIDKYLIKPINIIELNTIMDNIKNIDNKKIRKSLSNLRYRISIDDISNNDKLHLSNHISRSSNSSSSSSPTSIFNYQNISNCQD